MFDLSQFDTATAANSGGALHLKNDNGEPAFNGETPVTLSLYGTESDYYIAAFNRATRNMLAQDREDLTLEQRAELQVEMTATILSEITFDWSGIPGDDDQEQPFTREAAFELYRKYNKIRVQADQFISDSKNFTQG